MTTSTRSTLVLIVALFAACGAQDSQPLKQHDDTVRDLLTVCAAGGTLPGIDVSSYQGSINWSAVAGSGIKFAYTKATEGTSYKDPTFPANWSGMQANGVARGAYHFFHPGDDGTQQADYYLNYVGTIGAGDLPPMLDWEVSDGVGGATASANAQAFINEIAARTGKQTIIYTSPGLWSGFGASGFGGDALWVADYYNCYCDNGVCPAMPGGWSNWTSWQYSDRGSVPGIVGNVDLDIFNGDAAALAAFAGGTVGCTATSAIGHGVGSASEISGGACSGGTPGTTAPTACGAMASCEGLGSGQSVTSCDGRFGLVMQTDGNVVLYVNGNPLFDTHTNGKGGAAFIMQGDGNLVLYSTQGCAIWASNTAGNPGATLAVQDDGNLVIYDTNGHPLWSSGTGPIGSKVTSCGSMPAGSGLARGASVAACGGCFSLVMQGDGNLVMYQNGGTAIWNTQTGGTDGYTASMQSDGNLVLYSAQGCPMWYSATGGHSGATLAVQDDGNLVIYDANGSVLWASMSVACAGGCNCNPPSTTSTSTSTGTTTSSTTASSTTTGTSSTATSTTGTTSTSTSGTSSTSSTSTGTTGSETLSTSGTSGTTGHASTTSSTSGSSGTHASASSSGGSGSIEGTAGSSSGTSGTTCSSVKGKGCASVPGEELLAIVAAIGAMVRRRRVAS